MLTFEKLTRANFLKFEKEILKSEEAYPLELRWHKQDFLETFEENGWEIILAILEGNYIGNAIGAPMDEEELREHVENPTTPCKEIIYLYNIVIEKEHSGKGYGKALVNELIRIAKSQGYTRLMGHFRKNGSLQMAKKLGAKEICECRNWQGSGEDFVFCEIDVD